MSVVLQVFFAVGRSRAQWNHRRREGDNMTSSPGSWHSERTIFPDYGQVGNQKQSEYLRTKLDKGCSIECWTNSFVSVWRRVPSYFVAQDGRRNVRALQDSDWTLAQVDWSTLRTVLHGPQGWRPVANQ